MKAVNNLRIVSMLPGATEIVYLLGIGEQLHGVSHECDFPADARSKRVVTRSPFDPQTLPSIEIDRVVRETMAEGRELYHVDASTLAEIEPNLVLTQGLCDVCAVSVRFVQTTVTAGPEILSLDASSLEQVFRDIERVAEAAGVLERGEPVVRELRQRIDRVRRQVAHLSSKRVVCLEWLDPLFNAGHWVPEMVTLAGGVDALASPGKPSCQIAWTQVLEAAPEVLLLMPCGFGPERALQEMPLLARLPGWSQLPAVRLGQVWAVHSNWYFSRPGPRLVDGIELTAHILHSERLGPPDSTVAVRVPQENSCP